MYGNGNTKKYLQSFKFYDKFLFTIIDIESGQRRPEQKIAILPILAKRALELDLAEKRRNWRMVLKRPIILQQVDDLNLLGKDRVESWLTKLPQDGVIFFKQNDDFPKHLVRTLRMIRHADWIRKGVGLRPYPYHPAPDYTLVIDLRADLVWLRLKYQTNPQIDVPQLYQDSRAVLEQYYR